MEAIAREFRGSVFLPTVDPVKPAPEVRSALSTEGRPPTRKEKPVINGTSTTQESQGAALRRLRTASRVITSTER